MNVGSTKICIVALRDIGWSHWDPIGIKSLRDNADDEYDSYLLHVASLLINGHDKSEAIKYLLKSESCTMGLSTANVEAATNTVNEIYDYIVSIGYRQC